MELLATIISFTLLIATIIVPIVILVRLNRQNTKHKLAAFLILAFITTSIMTLALAWWGNISTKILLSHYGYDFDAMSDIERYANVSEENIERVKQLEISMMGIGWPLKAFMTYTVYSPYLVVVYLVSYVVLRYRRGIRAPN
jgi:hypothetical protein